MNALLSSRPRWLLGLMAAASLIGCDAPVAVQIQERVDFDRQVDTIWKKNWDWVDGLQFLEKGGLYVDTGEAGDRTYDRSQVLPLLRRLAGRHGLKWHAVVDRRQRNFAVAVVGRYPETDGIQGAVLESLRAEQESFPLDILVQGGNRWLSLDFLSEEDSRYLSGENSK